ncbi:hypothetical protein BC936DRAFT_136856 [Jimgerdemannia flammicorona]|uniref:Uncharacterized protein n=1 Tax=Jimgerdemannia flammicorona TaxID=994334 RepID=A0A433CYM2_9FUNG|nr:hypothetical protein BC936DRAFT_136856 [Jimgerdemannia flammicorona]
MFWSTVVTCVRKNGGPPLLLHSTHLFILTMDPNPFSHQPLLFFPEPFSPPLTSPASPIFPTSPTSPTFLPTHQLPSALTFAPALPPFTSQDPSKPPKPTNKNNTYRIPHRRASLASPDRPIFAMNGLTTIDMDSAMGTQPRTPNRRHSKSVGADSFPDSTPRNLPRPPPKKHSHHQPVTKFNTDMWKEVSSKVW